jgi:hypothetical protein
LFVCLEKMRSENIISHWYELQRNLFTLVLRDYIVEILSVLVIMNTKHFFRQCVTPNLLLSNT